MKYLNISKRFLIPTTKQKSTPNFDTALMASIPFKYSTSYRALFDRVEGTEAAAPNSRHRWLVLEITRRLPISLTRFRGKSAYPSATAKSSVSFKCRFSTLASSRKPHQLLSSTPCHLAYIEPCRCCQLPPYVHLNRIMKRLKGV